MRNLDLTLTAVKKRNPESMSPPLPDSKKLNHTVGEIESLKKDGLKKSKLNIVVSYLQLTISKFIFFWLSISIYIDGIAFVETRKLGLVPEGGYWANH